MKKELKGKIQNAFEAETPNKRLEILSACENETQVVATKTERKSRKTISFFRRFVSVACCLVLFGVGLLVGKILPQSQAEVTVEKRVYLDVNPSLEIALDKDNTVLTCTPANADAETLLKGMDLEGVTLPTALNAIVGAMYVNGYLSTEDNSMLISVDAINGGGTDEFLSYITNQVNEVFVNSEMECAIIAQSVTSDETLQRRAQEQGISVGKLYLLDKMVESMEFIFEEDISELAKMSIKDLNLMYAEKHGNGEHTGEHEGEWGEGEKKTDELIFGTVNVQVKAEDALLAVLTKLEKMETDVELYEIKLRPSQSDGKKVVYVVTLRFIGDEKIYAFEVDYKTGEIIEHDDFVDEHLPERVPEHEPEHE